MKNESRTYQHSAYWYAAQYGWSRSDAQSYSGTYLDIHTYYPRGTGRKGADGREAGWCFDSTFNPIVLGVCLATDIGLALRDTVRKITDPVERDRMKRELMRDLRSLRRPVYYERERARRRQLALERRKVTRREMDAPMPTADEIRAAWDRRTNSREDAIRLGGLLDTLACHVDSCLKFDEYGNVVGRNGGIRGWLRLCLPELAPKYKTLMRYKALATRLRQLTQTHDPVPTSRLLEEPLDEKVAALLGAPSRTFSQLFADVDYQLSPETVFLDPPRCTARPGRMADQMVKRVKKRRDKKREKIRQEFSALNSHKRSWRLEGR